MKTSAAVSLLLLLSLATTTSGQCPDPLDISPCVCSDLDPNLDLDCSLVKDEAQLVAVFQSNFPTPTFRRLTIYDNDNIKVLRRSVLGKITFIEVWVTSGALTEVEPDALPTTAQRLVFNFNNISTFPFASLQNFLNLTALDLRSNNLVGFPSITSTSLTVLYLSHNPLGQLPVDAFINIPAIKDLHLSNTQLPEVVKGTFAPLIQVKNIGLGNNLLTRLEEGAIQAAPTLSLLDLGYNQIHSVAPNVFPNLTNGWTYIHHNALTLLPEATWGAVLQGEDAYIDPYGNPLHCGCDVAWLLRNATLLKKIDVFTTCADGRLVVKLDPAEFDHC